MGSKKNDSLFWLLCFQKKNHFVLGLHTGPWQRATMPQARAPRDYWALGFNSETEDVLDVVDDQTNTVLERTSDDPIKPRDVSNVLLALSRCTLVAATDFPAAWKVTTDKLRSSKWTSAVPLSAGGRQIRAGVLRYLRAVDRPHDDGAPPAPRGARVFCSHLSGELAQHVASRVTHGDPRVLVRDTASAHVVRVKMRARSEEHLVLMGIHRHVVFHVKDVKLVKATVALGAGTTEFLVQRGSCYLPGLRGYEPIACSCKDWLYRGADAAVFGCKHMISVRLRHENALARV